MMTDENTDFQSSKSEISTLLSTLQEKLNAMIETIPENDGNLKKKEFEGFLNEFKVLSNKWGNLT